MPARSHLTDEVTQELSEVREDLESKRGGAVSVAEVVTEALRRAKEVARPCLHCGSQATFTTCTSCRQVS